MLAGGETAGPNSSFVRPTVLTDVRADMAVVREEIFGPVVVAQRYSDLLDGYVIDHADMSEVVSIDARVMLAQTLMTTIEDREALARPVLEAASVLRRRK